MGGRIRQTSSVRRCVVVVLGLCCWSADGLCASGTPRCTRCTPAIASRSSSASLSLSTEERRARQPTPVADQKHGDSNEPGGLVAAGALASSAVIAEAVQIGGTAVLLYFGQQWTVTDSPVEAVGAMIDYIQGLGAAGYGVFAVTMIFLQVVPIAAAFVLTVSAGAIFGVVRGTATVLTCSTISATISFFIARALLREPLLDATQSSKQFVAIDRAFGDADFQTSLTLITLLRLSPVLPFAWANYVFGLSPVPAAAFSIGTFVGCLPAVTGYVYAGQAGAEIAVNGAESNPAVLALGVAATLGAITFAGNIATSALKDLDLNLEE